MIKLSTAKTCNECGVDKELSEFHKNKRMKDGLFSKCKACASARSKVYSRKYREYHTEMAKEYAKTESGKAAIKRASMKYKKENGEKMKEKAAERWKRKVACEKACEGFDDPMEMRELAILGNASRFS